MSNGITWKTRAYGREADLRRMNRNRNSRKVGPLTRLGHDRAHTKIMMQLNDPVYCLLREQLIRAVIAGDQKVIAKIELRIRDHLNEPREAFSGAKDY